MGPAAAVAVSGNHWTDDAGAKRQMEPTIVDGESL